MNKNTKPRSKVLMLLSTLLILLGLGGIGGGVVMFADPSGELMGLPPGLLDDLPISNFIIPGLFLIIIMGIAPIVIASGLWKSLPWAWVGAIAQSIILILWILFQFFLWGNPIALQVIYLVWGIVMLGLCFVTGIKRE